MRKHNLHYLDNCIRDCPIYHLRHNRELGQSATSVDLPSNHSACDGCQELHKRTGRSNRHRLPWSLFLYRCPTSTSLVFVNWHRFIGVIFSPHLHPASSPRRSKRSISEPGPKQDQKSSMKELMTPNGLYATSRKEST